MLKFVCHINKSIYTHFRIYILGCICATTLGNDYKMFVQHLEPHSKSYTVIITIKIQTAFWLPTKIFPWKDEKHCIRNVNEHYFHKISKLSEGTKVMVIK